MNFAIVQERKLTSYFRQKAVLVTDTPEKIEGVAFKGVVFNRFHSYIEIELVSLKYSPTKFEELQFDIYLDSALLEAGFKSTGTGLYTFPVLVDQNTSDVLEVVRRVLVNLSNLACNLCLIHNL